MRICYISLTLFSMKKLLFTLLLLIAFPVMASHIVGGEFELLHISGSTYRLNLIIYFDKINGAVGAKDPNANVQIYRKSDNNLMANVLLDLVDEINVPYTQPECSNGQIVTSKINYTATLELSAANYSDPAGYYVVWQRCCRNYSISNIFSENPSNSGISAGQTFYLEFPAVVKDKKPFYNSSPRLFPPLNDYGCPFKPYYVDFAGIDDDNDSLVYSLVTPLNTTAAVALPPPSPRPYPDVTWRPGYGLTNIINGLPDLRISKDGFLRTTPRTQGLFVFAVKVEEFRNKQKIGESRRDFQMLVTDDCDDSVSPQILGKKSGQTSFTYDNTMTLNSPPDNRCIMVRVSDGDSERESPKEKDNKKENISVKAVGLNFKDENLNNDLFVGATTATLVEGSTADFTICFPECPYLESGTYQVGIVAFDDACSLPLSDTLKVTVTVQPPPNAPPRFTTAKLTEVYNIPEGVPHGNPLDGNPSPWFFRAVDDDLNNLTIAVVGTGFILEDAGLSYTITKDEPGVIEGILQWDPFCDIYNYTKRTDFEVKIFVEDSDLCEFTNLDIAVYKMSVKLPENKDPIIDTDLTASSSERSVIGLQRKVNQSLSFNVTGTDDQVENDFLHLFLNGKDDPSLVGASFSKADGISPVSSRFDWDIRCALLDLMKQEDYTFQFIVADSTNKCRILKTDTVDVQVKILPPDNSPAVLSIASLTDTPLNSNKLSVILGQPISLSLLGFDADVFPDKDLVSISLVEAKGNVSPAGFTFIPAEGKGSAQTKFSWTPDCSIFENDVYENNYTFKFRIVDDRCFSVEADTTAISIKIIDVNGSDKEFLPPNVITPNGDGCNDYFALEGIEESTCGLTMNADDAINLPKDNCVGRFQAIRIYNRWGKEVYESTLRNFRWDALNESAGVYFYIIEYSNRDYKGTLSVRP